MSEHVWEFFRAGGFDQVALERAADFRSLAELDQKLWVALASPVKGTTLDERTLTLIDEDGDGRIRAPQLLSTIAWMDTVLKDLGEISRRKDGLPLSSIRRDTELGQAILASAKRVLEIQGKDGGELVISVADTDEANARLDAQPYNGDGVLPPAVIDEDEVRRLAEEILEVTGGAADRSGAQGITVENVETFFAALASYDAWWRQTEGGPVALVPLGDRTAAAVEAYTSVRQKIDDYFTRTELASFDPRAAEHLGGAAAQWEPISARMLSDTDDEIAAFPIAAIAPGAALPLVEGINPAWFGAMKTLRDEVVTPLLGEQQVLTRAEWRSLGERFAAYEAWLAAKAGAEVEGLGIERVRELLEGDLRASLEELIARDEVRRPEAAALVDVSRAVRFYRDLHRLTDNFVSFRDFYAQPDLNATFQVGVLYLDGRTCDLCVRVEDIAAHSAMASKSYAYLAYCECVRRSTNEKMTIAAAFTNGDSDYLMMGRNGLFYDSLGQDWDATVVKIVEQPISIRQAFWSPYKRLVRFINEQAEKFAGDRDKASTEKMNKGVLDSGQAMEKPPVAAADGDVPVGAAGAAPAQPSAFDIGKFAGVFAAIGLALGFILSALTGVATGFLSLKLWQMPIALGGIALLISGPSMLIAALKLRQRNLAPILDASGWAINARARLNIPFGASLTSIATLPSGARRNLKDPYQERATPWRLYAALVVLLSVGAVLWDKGMLQEWIGFGQEDSVVAEVSVEVPVIISAPEAEGGAPAAGASPAP